MPIDLSLLAAASAVANVRYECHSAIVKGFGKLIPVNKILPFGNANEKCPPPCNQHLLSTINCQLNLTADL